MNIEQSTRAITIEMLIWMWPEHKEKIMAWDNKFAKKTTNDWRRTEYHTLENLINCVLNNKWVDSRLPAAQKVNYFDELYWD